MRRGPIAETTNAVPVARAVSVYPDEPEDRHRRDALALTIAAAAWFLPGLGHAFLKMWGRALVCFSTVAVLVILGAGMRGNIFRVTAKTLSPSSATLPTWVPAAFTLWPKPSSPPDPTFRTPTATTVLACSPPRES